MKTVGIFLIAVAMIVGMAGCDGDGTVVGPAGGTVIGPGGAMVTIPPGALEEDQLITISAIDTDDLPLPLPGNTCLLGGVRVGPSLIFNAPVTVTIPLTDSFTVGTKFPVLVFNLLTDEYKLETEALVTDSGNSVSFNVSHFSDYVIPGTTAAQADQMTLKLQIVSQISEFLEQHWACYFYREGFLSLGDIAKVRDRLYDDDIQVYIYPEYLEARDAEASYVDFDIWVHHWPPILFHNDIVIAVDPLEVDGITLYHEVMHAIHDEHDAELEAKGVPNDEALTWYMEMACAYINGALIPADVEFRKFIQGLPYDINTIGTGLAAFVTFMEEYRQDPGKLAVKEGSGTLPPLTAEALQFEKQLTGLDVDPAGIKAKYESLLEEAVEFPDPNLEAAIREAIGKPTGDIYPSDLAGLTLLVAYQRNITDLTGIEHCTSLISLYLWSNQISDISPLANLTSLTSLTLSSNQISDISPVAGLTSLTYLDVGLNEVVDISPLANLTSLTRLYLNDNQISDISALANLTGLTYLWLYSNQISDISHLAGLTSLTYLSINNNLISDISPLVENAGMGGGDLVDLWNNPLSDDSINIYIPGLEARGVTVYYYY